MGGDAVARLAANTEVDIALLAPIDPVGNRTCVRNWEWSGGYYCQGWFNFTRWRATHLEWIDWPLFNPPQRSFGPNVEYLYHRWQQEFNPPFDYGCPGLPPGCLSLKPDSEYYFIVDGNCINDQERMMTKGDSGYDVPVSRVVYKPFGNEGGPFDGHGEIVGFRGVVGKDILEILQAILNEFLNPWEWDLFNVESFPLALSVQGDWPLGGCDLEATGNETRPQRCREYHLKKWETDPNYLYKTGFEPWNPGLCMVSRDLCNILDTIVPDDTENLPPTADAGPDQTVPADDNCMGQVTLDGTASTDPEGEELTYTWTWNNGAGEATGPNPTIELPLGTHEITLVVSDGQVDSDPDMVVITVVDITPPVIELEGSAEMVLECAIDTWEDPGASATDNCDPDVAVSVGGDTVDTAMPGTYILTYDAVDDSGNAATQVMRTVVVQDTIPPTIESVTANPATLWPPNHSMVPVQLTVPVYDFCDATPDIMLTAVTSDEPDDAQGGGDGHTTGDIQQAGIGTEDYNILLRAERQGGGDGRVYTITYSATDDSGNSAGSGTVVTVGHDQNEQPRPRPPKRAKKEG